MKHGTSQFNRSLSRVNGFAGLRGHLTSQHVFESN